MAAQVTSKGLLARGMSGPVEIVASFADESGCAGCIEKLRSANPIAVRVFSPIPSHHIEHAIGKRKSPVRAFVLTGGILGVISALALTLGTSWDARYSSRFSGDRFGIVLRCEEGDVARFETILKDAGAEEVGREAA